MRIYLGGDLMPGRVMNHFDDAKWERIFAFLNEQVHDADLIVFNLEAPLQEGARSTGVMDLTAAPDFLNVFPLVPAVVTVANNHSLDNGASGQEETIRILREHGLEEEHGQGRFVSAAGVPVYAAAIDATRMDFHLLEEFSHSLETLCPDHFCIVSIHWGKEYSVMEGEEQQRIAHELAEAGVDVILGHHPHVLQPVEWMETDHGSTLVAYSMGNLLSDMTLPDTMRTAIVRIDLAGDGFSVCAIPLVIAAGTKEIKPAGERDAEIIVSRLGLDVCE